jgi:hypothetical protein
MNQINPVLFSPCFTTEEDFEAAYKTSVFYVEGEYMNEYQKHIAAMGHIANMAKVYILKNWKSVTDWSGLDMKITHGPSGEVTEYYNHEKALQREAERKKYNEERARERAESGKKPITESTYFKKHFKEMLQKNAEKHNPILEFTEVVLDPTDGDFSVTINGDKNYWWIHDEEVIIIADYIEKHLKRKECIQQNM